jgi:hypothetical protein
MTTPRVTELPRRLEPSSRDTFLGPADEAPLAVVLQMRPRDARRPPNRRRRASRPLALVPFIGPGNSAA